MEMMQNPYLEEYLNYWFFQIEKNLIKPSTVSTFYTLISRHIIPKLGHLRLSELNLFILQQFFNQKYENGRLDQKGGLSYQTLNSIYSILNLALNYAVCNELVQKNYCQDVRLPKPQWKSVRVFSKSEQKKIETAALNSKNPNGIGIILCLYTGIRIGELCGLHMEDINLENRILYIRRTLERIVCISDNAGKTCIYEGYPKSRSSIRDIPIPAFLIPLLQNYCNTYRMNASAQAPFICGKKGKIIEPRIYQNYFQTLLTKANVTKANFHCLRHTFATRALEAGIDPKTLSEILGHATPSITMNIYAHSLYEHKFEAMELLAAFYEK